MPLMSSGASTYADDEISTTSLNDVVADRNTMMFQFGNKGFPVEPMLREGVFQKCAIEPASESMAGDFFKEKSAARLQHTSDL